MSKVDPKDVIKELTIGLLGQQSTFVLTKDALHVNRQADKKWPYIVTPMRHVVWAELEDNNVEVSLLAKKKPKQHLVLLRLTGKVEQDDRQKVSEFVDALMDLAYRGVKKRRHLRVLVNPRAGPGKSVQNYHGKVEPLFRAARCTTETTFTTHHHHATTIAQTLPLNTFDALVTMSGDGLVHEVINGYRNHQDSPEEAFKIPIAPIPAGSGNGIALNLLGMEEGFDVMAAALNAAKGISTPIDLFRITQGSNQYLSFFTQTLGLMSELDLGTENMRFLGDGRFVVGYLRGLIQHRTCPLEVSIKPAANMGVNGQDKKAMVRALHEAQEKAKMRMRTLGLGSESRSEDENVEGGGDANGANHENANDTSASASSPDLPQPQDQPASPNSAPGSSGDSPADADGWIKFSKPILYLYAGKGPWVSRDLMQFPVSVMGDGCVDVVLQEKTTRNTMLKAMDGAEKGDCFWLDSQHYFKATRYRVAPHPTARTYLSVDGEGYPFEPYEVEVCKEMANVLSPFGCYAAQFEMRE